MRILSICLLLSLPFAAFSDDFPYPISECSPPSVEEEAECYCHHFDGFEFWSVGFGATYEEAEQDAINECKSDVRFILTVERGLSEAEADQYDYSSHVTNQCRPTSCSLSRQRKGLIP